MKSINKPFGHALADLGERYKNLVVVDADLQRATETYFFQEKFPDRHFDVGIAEANMVGISAGLALSGKIAFCGTFACFIHVEAKTHLGAGAADDVGDFEIPHGYVRIANPQGACQPVAVDFVERDWQRARTDVLNCAHVTPAFALIATAIALIRGMP